MQISLDYYKKTYYLRDAQGNIMATYNRTYAGESIQDLTMSFSLVERPIYGSSRIANFVDSVQLVYLEAEETEFSYPDDIELLEQNNGTKHFELTNHLGNVMAVVSDKRTPVLNATATAIETFQPELLIAKDYYPFGMEMSGRYGGDNGTEPIDVGYRFGFNKGSEKDDEITGVTGSHYTTFYRELDTRVVRWWTIDPKTSLTPWESPYTSMGNNPIWFNDPLGDIVDGDEKGKENYKNYRKEVNARINSLNNKLEGLDENSDTFSKLNEQLNSYNQINVELDALEADQENLYFINSDVTFEKSFGEGQSQGRTYFKGFTNYEGREIKQINIDLAEKMFPMSNLAHEFKHAHQYYEGRIIFIAGTTGGFNSQELENEAFERGGRFSGNLQTTNNRFKINYTYKPELIFDNYKKLPPKVNSIYENNTKEQMDYLNKTKGLKYIYNDPTTK